MLRAISRDGLGVKIVTRSRAKERAAGNAVNRLKTVLRIGGIVVAGIGGMCLPIGFGDNPKRDLSLFNNLADLGAFVQIGLLLIALGLVVLGVSYAIPGEMSD